MSVLTDENFDKLADFIKERYFFGKIDTLDREAPLFSNGVIDSLSALELILKIEELFQTEFHIQHLIDDQVDTFSQLQATINRVLG